MMLRHPSRICLTCRQISPAVSFIASAEVGKGCCPDKNVPQSHELRPILLQHRTRASSTNSPMHKDELHHPL